MLSSITLHIPASYFAVCLVLAFAIGAVVGIIGSVPFNKNQEHNDTEYPDYRR